MATAEQIKALLRSHVEKDDSRFYSTALQVAAKEARNGHHKLAVEIKDLIEKAQKPLNGPMLVGKATSISKQVSTELDGLLEKTISPYHLSELVLSQEVLSRIKRIILEQRQKDKLSQFALHPRRKILFTGPPGTGKTMSAAILSDELGLPFYTIVLDSLITRYMGETAAKLRLIFDRIKQTRAVYLFDEFDAIGSQRGGANDVGEIRRVLNSFLMFVEQDTSESLIVAATNHPELLDRALHRRFDDIIKFEKPQKDQIETLIKNKLSIFNLKRIDWAKVTGAALGLSAADVCRACEDAAKDTVLNHEDDISTIRLLEAIKYKNYGKQ